MKEIAKTFLAASHAAPWVRDESARALVNFVYEGGVWDAHAREKYPLIRKKPSREWSLDDVFAYLTFIVVVDRTNEGCIDSHIADGTVAGLLRRYLELVEVEGGSPVP